MATRKKNKEVKKMAESELVYIHSKCCNSHWAVVCTNEGYFLHCDHCGKSSGLEVLGLEVEGEDFCFHSCCCDAHWELTYCDGQYQLLCENCMKTSGCLIVVGPHLDNPKCNCCDDENS